MDFPLADFRILYPAFAEVDDEVVEAVAKQALCFVNQCGGDCFDQLWMLAVAHMLMLRKNIEEGSAQPGAIASATIDKVSVSFSVRQASSDTSQWFGLTPYGMQFLALARRCAGAGFFVAGMPERSAFRSVGGRFPRRGRPW